MASESSCNTDALVRKSVRRRWFELIAAGKKVVEGRLAAGFWSKDRLVVGSTFILESEEDEVTVTVVSVSYYASFRELIETETLERVLPTVTSVDDGVAIYREFYPEDAEKEFGVVGVGMHVSPMRRRLGDVSATGAQ